MKYCRAVKRFVYANADTYNVINKGETEALAYRRKLAEETMEKRDRKDQKKSGM